MVAYCPKSPLLWNDLSDIEMTLCPTLIVMLAAYFFSAVTYSSKIINFQGVLRIIRYG